MSILKQYEGYDEEVLGYIRQVKDSRIKDIEKTKAGCDWLLCYAKEHEEPKLAAFAYYYLGETALNHSDKGETCRLLVEGLKYQQFGPDYELEAKTYNVLGIMAHEQRDYVTALEYYFTAAEIGKAHGMSQMDVAVSTNIGGIYDAIGDYEQAKIFYMRAIDIIDKEESTSAYILWNLMNLYILVGRCYLKIGRKADSIFYKCKVEKILEYPSEEMYELFAIYVFLYEMALFEKQKEKAAYYRGLAEECITNSNHIFEFAEDIVCFCGLLLEEGEFEEFLSLSGFLKEKSAQLDMVQTRLGLMELRLTYYEKIEDEDSYNAQMKEMLKLLLKQQKENEKSISVTIELKQHLQRIKDQQLEMMKRNEALLIKVQLDSMTGIANRGKLNEYAEAKFEEAKKNGTYFGVSILDIDHFKQYNDSYGHMQGDSCITAIAEVLKGTSADNIFCARYGGDEFVLVFDDMTTEKVRQVLENVRKQVYALNLEHKSSLVSNRVTVTLGCMNAIPQEINRLWDYMHLADLTLYDAKNAGKNRALIVEK